MTWGTSFDPFAGGSASEGRLERIELIGLHLRLLGTVALGRFHRLSDFVNASHGYVRVRDAELLDASGKPTDVRLPELMVDQDEIAFMVQVEAAEANTANADQPDAPPAEARDVGGRTTDVWDTGTGTDSAPGISFGGAQVERAPRRFMLFTTSHAVSGAIHLFGDTDLAGFVASTDPRYVPVTDVTLRSLADPGTEEQFPFLLINRTTMVAASEIQEG